MGSFKLTATARDNLPEIKEHWFSYGDCCLAITEHLPAESTAPHQRILFFLHGRFGQAEMWKPLVQSLSNHFRCFRIDLPGFGRSFCVRDRGFSLLEQSHIVQCVLQRFASRGTKAVLIGHDIGGAIAQLCAIHEPETLEGLVLINSAALTQEPRDLKTGFGCLHVRRKLRKLIRSLTGRLAPEQETLLLSGWENRSRRMALVQAFQTWEYTWPGPFERQTWREEIRKITQPVLLLWGNRDPLNPPDQAEALMRDLPEAYLFEDEQAGHWPCLEKTAWVDDKMREFLFRLGVANNYGHWRAAGGGR